MKFLFTVLLIALTTITILFSGCVSNNENQKDLTDGNWMKNSETSGNEIVEDIYSDTEEIMNAENNGQMELKDNEVKHCVCHLNEIQYDYWIGKEELAREATFGGKVKNTINKIESCGIQEGIPKQCGPLDEDFEQIRNEWIKETETMTCNCDIITYDTKYFN